MIYKYLQFSYKCFMNDNDFFNGVEFTRINLSHKVAGILQHSGRFDMFKERKKFSIIPKLITASPNWHSKFTLFVLGKVFVYEYIPMKFNKKKNL